MTDWEKCVAFHGHACGGLTIGYKAAQYAARPSENFSFWTTWDIR